MKKILLLVSLSFFFCSALHAELLGLSLMVEPYAGIIGTKTKAKSPVDSNHTVELERKRTQYGVRASLGLFTLLKLQVGLGTNKLDSDTTVSNAVDTYGKIDFKKDLNLSISNPDAQVKISEEEKRAEVNLLLNQSLIIAQLRAKAGVQAIQRTVSLTQDGVTTKVSPPVIFAPLAGLGIGLNIGLLSYLMAEYNFSFPMFPKTEPYEQQVSIAYGIGF